MLLPAWLGSPGCLQTLFFSVSPPIFPCQADGSISIPPLHSPTMLPTAPTILHPALHPAAIPFPQADAQDPGMVSSHQAEKCTWEASLGEHKWDLHPIGTGHGACGHWVATPHPLKLLLCCFIITSLNHNGPLAALPGAGGVPEHTLYTTDTSNLFWCAAPPNRRGILAKGPSSSGSPGCLPRGSAAQSQLNLPSHWPHIFPRAGCRASISHTARTAAMPATSPQSRNPESL